MSGGGRHLAPSRNKARFWVIGALAVVLAGVGGYWWMSSAPPGGAPAVQAPVPTATAVATPTPTPTPPATATAAPTSTPGPTPDPLFARAQELLGGMTEREKLCQLFIVYQDDLTGISPTTVSGPRTQAGLEKWPVAGIIYNTANLTGPEQTRKLITGIQSYSRLGLFISADEEGGTVSRLTKHLGTAKFDSMYEYRDQGAETARSNAYTIASDMASFGFNLDFAPVADVWSNPDNTVIGKRAYSDDPQEAAELVSAAVEGFHEGGMACAVKHFPGHGDTEEDSHKGSAYVNRSPEELEACELIPFRAGIAAGADMVMVGHLIVPTLDGLPASISPKIITELLRGELGYGGVVITDALAMGAISADYTPGEVAVRAINAGVDLLLCPEDLPASLQGLEDALAGGTLTWERVDESVLRILTLKLERGIITS